MVAVSDSDSGGAQGTAPTPTIGVSSPDTFSGNDGTLCVINVWDCSSCVQAICWTQPQGGRAFPAFVGQQPPLCIPLTSTATQAQTPGPPGA